MPYTENLCKNPMHSWKYKLGGTSIQNRENIEKIISKINSTLDCNHLPVKSWYYHKRRDNDKQFSGIICHKDRSVICFRINPATFDFNDNEIIRGKRWFFAEAKEARINIIPKNFPLIMDCLSHAYDESAHTASQNSEPLGIPPQENRGSRMISPSTPFSNETAIIKTLHACEDHIYWIDKYFSRKGLEWLNDSLEDNKVKTVKILVANNRKRPKLIKNLRESFKKFRSENKEKGILCELRVIIDDRLASNIHDRWIITKNTTYNVPSTDVIARGQYSEIKGDANRPDFEAWWDQSLDIIDKWNELE